MTEIQAEAFRLVAAMLDDGYRFQRLRWQSLEFAQAVEEARVMRAFQPGKLRQIVQANRSNP